MNYELVKSNLDSVLQSLPNGVDLVAVSKYHPVEAIKVAYEAGWRTFGESREQELRVKYDLLPKDIKWNFIGHLQTNKVKYIAPYIAMIEAVDSYKLMKEIDRQAEKNNRIIDILLELHLAKEETKSGMNIADCLSLLEEGSWAIMQHIRIRGIMMMASNTDDEELIRKEFTLADELFQRIKKQYFQNKDYFNIKSYGMSHDYLLAVECGSNHVRVGSKIFNC